MAATILDILGKPALVDSAWSYFRNVQTKDTKYEPLMRAHEQPPTFLNQDILAKHREQMQRYYYDPSKPGTYLEQLGIKYPTVKSADGKCEAASVVP
jgi:aminobenzoyl-glutamate utilization protein B